MSSLESLVGVYSRTREEKVGFARDPNNSSSLMEQCGKIQSKIVIEWMSGGRTPPPVAELSQLDAPD